MEISQKLLGLLFAVSVVAGTGLGCLWNLLRLLRALCGVGTVQTPAQGEAFSGCPLRRRVFCGLRAAWLFLWDALFGLCCVCVLILLLYYANDGQFRFLAAAGMGCGFFAWYHTLGHWIGALTDALARRMHHLGDAAVRRVNAWRIRHSQKKEDVSAYESGNREESTPSGDGNDADAR